MQPVVPSSNGQSATGHNSSAAASSGPESTDLFAAIMAVLTNSLSASIDTNAESGKGKEQATAQDEAGATLILPGEVKATDLSNALVEAVANTEVAATVKTNSVATASVEIPMLKVEAPKTEVTTQIAAQVDVQMSAEQTAEKVSPATTNNGTQQNNQPTQTTAHSNAGAVVTHTPGEPAVVVLPESSNNDSPIRALGTEQPKTQQSNQEQVEVELVTTEAVPEKSIDVRPSVTTATSRSHVDQSQSNENGVTTATDADEDSSKVSVATGKIQVKTQEKYESSSQGKPDYAQSEQHTATQNANVSTKATVVNVVETDTGRTITVTKGEVVRQVVEVVRPVESLADGMHRISLRLRPAELGNIHVSMEVNNHSVRVHLNAENPETARLLVDSVGELRSEMENLGYSNSQFDVSTGKHQQQNQQGSSDSQGNQLPSEQDELVLAELRALASQSNSDSELDVKV